MIRKNKIKISTSINPGDNFYMYTNDTWLKETAIPDSISSFSITEEIEESIDKDLSFLLEECKTYAEKGLTTHSYENKLRDTIGKFVLSCRKTVRKNSIHTLKDTLQKLSCIRSIEDIGEVLGYFCKKNIETIFGSFLQQEKINMKESMYVIYFINNNLGLPDTSYYNATAPGKIRTLMSYIKMIRKVCKELDIDDISDIVSIESYFSAKFKNLNNSNKNTLLLKGHELETMFKGFPWKSFFKSYGIESYKNIYFRISSKKFIQLLEKAFQEIPLADFKKLFMLHIILDALPMLPSPYDDMYFEFFDSKLGGQKKKLTIDELMLDLSKKYLTQPLSILYKKSFLENSLKKHATHFIEKIRDSALKQIESNRWLEGDTKKIAREKVKNMVLSIGWPEKYLDLELPVLYSDNLLENMYLLCNSMTNQNIQYQNTKTHPGITWSEPAFLVNAFYYNELNEFIIPAGSLYFPFFSEESISIGWNYGGLGAVIGHEMVHAFDNEGKDYNQYGIYKPWWHSIDNRRFNHISKEMIELYNTSKILGRPVNGTLTLNENLADLGGLSIALEALKKEISNFPEKKKKEELQHFFLSYAVSWRTKEEKKKVLQELFLDKHAPPQLRVNNIVCQFDEWYDAFDITILAKMFVAPEDRIRVY